MGCGSGSGFPRTAISRRPSDRPSATIDVGSRSPRIATCRHLCDANQEPDAKLGSSPPVGAGRSLPIRPSGPESALAAATSARARARQTRATSLPGASLRRSESAIRRREVHSKPVFSRRALWSAVYNSGSENMSLRSKPMICLEFPQIGHPLVTPYSVRG